MSLGRGIVETFLAVGLMNTVWLPPSRTKAYPCRDKCRSRSRRFTP